MLTSTFVLDPRYRWEPGCEFLLYWSSGKRPGHELEADGAHSAGSDGVRRARSILANGSLFRDWYGPDVPHAFWHVAVWDAVPFEGPFPSGLLDFPESVLPGPDDGSTHWYAVSVGPEPGPAGALDAAWAEFPDRETAFRSVPPESPGTAVFVLSLQRMED